MLTMLLLIAGISREPGDIALEAVRRGLANAMVQYDCAAGSLLACKVLEATRDDSVTLARVFTGVVIEAQGYCAAGDRFNCELLNRIDAVAKIVLESHRV